MNWLMKFIEDYKFTKVKNAFLFPTYDEKVENKGHVKRNIV